MTVQRSAAMADSGYDRAVGSRAGIGVRSPFDAVSRGQRRAPA